jgi:hypothetical protein
MDKGRKWFNTAVARLASEPSCTEFYAVKPIVLGFRVETQGFSENRFREPWRQ